MSAPTLLGPLFLVLQGYVLKCVSKLQLCLSFPHVSEHIKDEPIGFEIISKTTVQLNTSEENSREALKCSRYLLIAYYS